MMYRTALIVFATTLVIGSLPLSASTSHSSNPAQQSQQEIKPLSLDQLRDLIKNGTPDSAIAIEIDRRDINFLIEPKLIDSLRRLGAGRKTLESLEKRLQSTIKNEDPCLSDLSKIVVLVANFHSLDRNEDSAITEIILDQLREATRDYPDTEIMALNESITSQQGRQVAVAKGRERKATVVLWGWYKRSNENVTLTVHFELPTPVPSLTFQSHKQTQVFALPEIESFMVQSIVSKQMTYLTLLTVGFARLQADDYQGAIERFTKALKEGVAPEQMVSPWLLFFFRGLSFYLASFGSGGNPSLRNAIVDLNAAADVNRNEPKIFLILGYAYFNNRVLERSLDAAATVVSLNAPAEYRASALALMSAISALQGNDEKTSEYATLAIKILEPLPGSQEKFFILSQAYLLTEDLIRAAANLEEASKLATCDRAKATFTYLRGAVYAQSKNFDKAIAEFDVAIRLRPDWSHGYWARGLAHHEKKQYDRAITDYNKAISLNPEGADFYEARGDAFDALDKLNEAISDYKKAIELDKSLASAYYSLGLIYRRTSRFKDAIQSFTEFIRLEPADSDGYRNRALAYERNGEFDAAILDTTQILVLKPGELESYKVRARLYESKGDLVRAIDDYSSFIKFKPEDAYGYRWRGWAYYKSKRFDQAITDLNKAVEIKPDDADTYLIRGTVHHRAGNDDIAIEDFKTVIKITNEEELKKIAESEIERIGIERERKALELKQKNKPQ